MVINFCFPDPSRDSYVALSAGSQRALDLLYRCAVEASRDGADEDVQAILHRTMAYLLHNTKAPRSSVARWLSRINGTPSFATDEEEQKYSGLDDGDKLAWKILSAKALEEFRIADRRNTSWKHDAAEEILSNAADFLLNRGFVGFHNSSVEDYEDWLRVKSRKVKVA